jgi:hypothetical protein
MKKQRQGKHDQSPKTPKEKKGPSEAKLFISIYTCASNASSKLLEVEHLLKELGEFGIEY